MEPNVSLGIWSGVKQENGTFLHLVMEVDKVFSLA